MSAMSRLPRWRFVAAAAAAVALGAGVLVATATGDDRRAAPVPAGRVVPPAERLVPAPDFMTLRAAGDEVPDQLAIPVFEVLPGGAVREVPLKRPAHTLLAGVRPLPDGRTLAVASRDLRPGQRRVDGPFVEGVAFPLMVFGATGTLESDVDMRVVGQHVRLLAATATEAVLLRTAGDRTRVVGRDLSTGAERVLLETALEVTAVDVAGNRVVTAADCRLFTSTVDIEVPACRHITDLNVAPDGRLAAVVYERPGELRLRIVDLDTAEVYSDEPFAPEEPCSSCVVTARGAGYLGMAWADNTTLRVARMDPLPLDFDPAHVLTDINDRVDETTRTVPMTG